MTSWPVGVDVDLCPPLREMRRKNVIRGGNICHPKTSEEALFLPKTGKDADFSAVRMATLRRNTFCFPSPAHRYKPEHNCDPARRGCSLQVGTGDKIENTRHWRIEKHGQGSKAPMG